MPNYFLGEVGSRDMLLSLIFHFLSVVMIDRRVSRYTTLGKAIFFFGV